MSMGSEITVIIDERFNRPNLPAALPPAMETQPEVRMTMTEMAAYRHLRSGKSRNRIVKEYILSNESYTPSLFDLQR